MNETNASMRSLWTLRMWVTRPPAVFIFLPHTRHLKCLAFWCATSTRSSSKSRSQYQQNGFCTRAPFFFFPIAVKHTPSVRQFVRSFVHSEKERKKAVFL